MQSRHNAVRFWTTTRTQRQPETEQVENKSIRILQLERCTHYRFIIVLVASETLGEDPEEREATSAARA